MNQRTDRWARRTKDSTYFRSDTSEIVVANPLPIGRMRGDAVRVRGLSIHVVGSRPIEHAELLTDLSASNNDEQQRSHGTHFEEGQGAVLSGVRSRYNERKGSSIASHSRLPKPPPSVSVPIDMEFVSLAKVKLRPYVAKPRFNFFAGHPLISQY